LNSSTGTSSAVNNNGTLIYALDYDNVTALGGTGDDNLRCYPNSREISAHQAVTISVAPNRKLQGLDIGGTSQTSQTITREWQDMAYTNTPWFGIRTMVSPTTNAGDITYDVRCTIYFQCKSVI